MPRVEAVRTCLQHSSSSAKSVSTDAKHNSTSQHDQRKTKSPSTVSHTARAIRGRFYAKAMTPETVAQASLLFSAAEAPFTRKNAMFRAIPNTQIASMRYKNEAFVQGFLRIPRPAQL